MAEGQGSGWVKGCAIGCAIVLLLCAAVGVGLYFMAQKMMTEGQAQFQQETANQHATLILEVEMSDEQRALVDTLFEHSQRQDYGFPATLVSGVTLMIVFEDKTIDEEETALLREVVDLLAANPDPGWTEMGTGMNSHPELQRRLQELQNSRLDETVDIEITPPTEEEAPTEAAVEQ